MVGEDPFGGYPDYTEYSILTVMDIKATSYPCVTCDKCGMRREVKKLPESTIRWFKKYHKNCGTPVYTAGVHFGLSRLTGQ